MSIKKNTALLAAVLGIFFLSTAYQAAGQENLPPQTEETAAVEQPQENAAPEAEQPSQPQENLFKLKDSIVADLEDRLDEEKFAKVAELQGNDFSEASLTEALQIAGLSAEEIDTVLNIVKEDIKLAQAVKKAAPVALALNKAEAALKAQEELLEKTQIEEERDKIAKDIRQLRKQLRKEEHNLSQIMNGVDGSKTEQVAAVLQEAEYESDDVEIINEQLLNQALFAKKLGTLTEMTESIKTINEEISVYEKKLKQAGSEEEKKSTSEYLAELNERLAKTKNDFSVLTTGIDYSSFLKKEGKEVEWDKELKEIFSPIIVELKETTERPRQMERLRSDIMYLEKRIPQVRQASADLAKFLEKIDDQKVKERLESWKDYWEQLEKEFATRLEANRNQLLQLENERKSLLSSFKVFFDSFVKHRGKSLFFALLAFVGIYLAFRLLQRIIWKISPFHKSAKYMFWANLVDVMFYALAILVATGGLVAVLFTSGDWLILAIVLLLVFGIIWGAKNTLPEFAEQIKLLLGFGPVRQGELVMVGGLPYRVEMMGVYSYLENPLLNSGGTLRLPLKDLVGMRSRPYDEQTVVWFPCKVGEVVLINGSIMRKVLMISPQYVKLDWYGCDMDEYMPTSTFMNSTLLSLARPFWAGINFLVSYQHRDYLEIIDKLTPFVREELKKLPYAEQIIDIDNPWIELGALDEKSMKFMVWIKAAPEIAIKYDGIKRAILHICLRAANTYSWDIIQYNHEMQGQGIQEYKPLMLKQDAAEKEASAA